MGQGTSVVSYLIHPAALRQSRIHSQSGRVVPAGAFGPKELERPERNVSVLLRRRGALKVLELARDDGLVLHSVQRKVPAVELVKRLLLDEGEDERRPPVGEAKAGRAVRPFVDKGRWKFAVCVVIVVQGQPELLQVVGTLDPVSRLPDLLDGWK